MDNIPEIDDGDKDLFFVSTIFLIFLTSETYKDNLDELIPALVIYACPLPVPGVDGAYKDTFVPETLVNDVATFPVSPVTKFLIFNTWPESEILSPLDTNTLDIMLTVLPA